MKPVRVRTMLFAALFMLVTIAWVTYVLVLLVQTGSLRMGSSGPSHAGIAASVSISLLAAAVLFGYGLHKWMIRPLEALGQAARQVAKGDLDIALPASGVQEIAEVKLGFDVMLEGLRRSAGQRAALDEERRFFVGAIAHDLRTPLFALNGYLEGLQRGIAATPEQKEHYLDVCRQKANQLDRLVTDLLTFAKTEYMESVPRQEPVDLGELLGNAVEAIRPLADAKRIGLRMDTNSADRPHRIVAGDAYLLERACSNLLDNAVRFTPDGGLIEVACRSTPDGVELSVRDTGPGIPAAELELVFDPLYRGESSRSRESGGTGLGLTIARRIFKAHGGDLTASQHPQGGAVLTGRLLRERADS